MKKFLLLLILIVVPLSIFGAFLNSSMDGSISFNWFTDEEADSLGILYDENWNVIQREYIDKKSNFHKIFFSELNPKKFYRYRVQSFKKDNLVYDYDAAFILKLEDREPFNFVVYGDNRGGFETHKLLCNMIKNYEPELIVNSGDLVYNDLFLGDWEEFFKAIDDTGNSLYYAAIGNHEKIAGNFSRFFQFPGNESYYSFRQSGVFFIVLNSNDEFHIYSNQYKWLEKQLNSEERLKSEFTVIVIHHPPYSYGDHGDSFFLKLILVPLFEEKGVDLVVSGHDHNYQRIEVNDITYIVSGGAGAPLYGIEFDEGEYLIKGIKENHFILFKYFPGEMKIECILKNGEVFDSTIIKK